VEPAGEARADLVGPRPPPRLLEARSHSPQGRGQRVARTQTGGELPRVLSPRRFGGGKVPAGGGFAEPGGRGATVRKPCCICNPAGCPPPSSAPISSRIGGRRHLPRKPVEEQEPTLPAGPSGISTPRGRGILSEGWPTREAGAGVHLVSEESNPSGGAGGTAGGGLEATKDRVRISLTARAGEVQVDLACAGPPPRLHEARSHPPPGAGTQTATTDPAR
jgi:hypothetical protein